jgi:hypothetical protein
MGKKSNKTTSRTVYGKTTTVNPYVTSSTNNKGTVSVLNDNTAFSSINNFVNKNMDKLLKEYLNPTLNSTTNKAKMNSFTDSLNSATAANLENNIINPLSRRNMVRSSQATDMYNSLAQNNANQIASYAQELLGNSQKDTASLLTNLMLLYMNGYNALSDTQKQSLSTSQGNATKTQTTSGGSSADMSQMMQMVTQMAMMLASL